MGMHFDVTEAEVYLTTSDMEDIADEYITEMAKNDKLGLVKFLQEAIADLPEIAKSVIDLVPEQELKDYVASNFTARSLFPASEMEAWALYNGWRKA